MSLVTSSVLFFLFHLVFFIIFADSKCQKSFKCGNLGILEFPFFLNNTESDCGLFPVDCTSSPPKLQLRPGGVCYEVHEKVSTNKFRVLDPTLRDRLNSDERNCSFVANWSPPNSSVSNFTISFVPLTIFSCTKFLDPNEAVTIQEHFKGYRSFTNCDNMTLYYKDPSDPATHFAPDESTIPENCSFVQMPRNPFLGPSNPFRDDMFRWLSAVFDLEWTISDECLACHYKGRKCLINRENKFQCKGKSRKTVILASALAGSAVFLGLCFLFAFILYHRKKRNNGAYFLSRNISSDPSSRSDIEGGSFYFGIPIFSYKELEVATNNFDASKELGDGGFGTVYHGKLRDGREVAIKRLYEHNCRRVEQFLNEIKILTCLRHPNLVSLYGCTSRRSRELLLVYEYIPNGTVADHLHGERAKEAPLTWPVRMSIAIETASALAYLHKSDIIHRDVKTNNILLDNSFCVKVADFGLSRLFPNDVTHISTAPQGTPGYVDPEYHQCYQLTDKSDVYSFGVVLIELISSMPAVDISRHRHEINLANLAVNRIQRCAFEELIDPSLGYDSDAEVTRMTTSVAELAFRCLQLEKDMRPSMDEVLVFLKDIQAGEDCKYENIGGANGNYSVPGKIIPPSPETDDVVLLKNKNFQSSPNAVADAWISGSSTTTTSSIG